MENGIIKAVQTGEPFSMPYQSKIDITEPLKQAYNNIDFSRVQTKITEYLEEELARKIVNKVITEMGTDIKKLMSNNTIRDDFRYLLRRGIDDLLEKVKKEDE